MPWVSLTTPPAPLPHPAPQVGYGRKTYNATKDLVGSWGQFQLPWAQVAPDTPLVPGGPVCVAANVFGLWTAVPLQLLWVVARVCRPRPVLRTCITVAIRLAALPV